jgi:hypothetical protein
MRSILAKVTDLSATHNENPSPRRSRQAYQVRDNFAGIHPSESCKKRQKTFEKRQLKLDSSRKRGPAVILKNNHIRHWTKDSISRSGISLM